MGISIAFLLFVGLAVKAPAQELSCYWRTFCRADDWYAITGSSSCVQRRVCVNAWYRHRSYEPRRDREAYYRRNDPRPEADDGKRCKWSHWIRATGNDKLSEQDARVSAQERWSATVEVRHGSLYSDVDKAEEFLTTCVRKVPTTATQSIGAALGQKHYVCEVEGVPCAPPREDLDPAKRRIDRVKESVEKRGDQEERKDRDDARRR